MKLLIPALIGLACLLIPVGYLYVLSFTAARPANLGLAGGRLRPCPSSPNCVCSQDADAGHAIGPIVWSGSASEGVNRIKQVLATLPRMRIATEHDDYLHVEATSLLFRFVDDVEFFVDPANGVIHVRSASRVGHSDLNANRARVEAIRTAFEHSPKSP